jgi:hypothetical protein
MNKYVEEEMNSRKFLPDTMRDFELMNPADQARVPMAHIVKLRNQLNQDLKEDDKSSFVKNPIKFND